MRFLLTEQRHSTHEEVPFLGGGLISQLAVKSNLKMLTASCLCCSDDSRKRSEILTTDNKMFVKAFVPAAEWFSTKTTHLLYRQS